jgi:hypothetical protein
MLDDHAEWCRKADSCRTLAKLSDTAERKALWLARADHWQELALKRVERLLQSVKSKPMTDGPEKEIPSE